MGPDRKRTLITVGAVVIAALLGSAGVWYVMSSRLTQARQQAELDETRITALESEVESLTAVLAERAEDDAKALVAEQEDDSTPGTTTPAGKKPSEEPAGAKEADGRFFCFITSARWEGASPELTVDYAQMLTGDAAAAAAAAAGEESPPPNDYYIVNENPRLRTFPADSTMKVRMTTSISEGSKPGGYNMPFGEWFDAFSGMSGHFPAIRTVPYWITVKGGIITGIEEQYLP